jgi:hypothetical protein
MVEPGRLNERHKINDYAFFASLSVTFLEYTPQSETLTQGSWFPKASLGELKTVAMYNTWAFVWDDQADAAGFEYSNDLDRASQYRKATRYFYKKFLGLADDTEVAPPGTNKVDMVNHVVERFSEPLNRFYGQRK